MIESGLFPGFLVEDIWATGARMRTLRAGSGLPLLLLHGYPQTHFIWRKIASCLAERFAVVLTDLRSYGVSRMDRRFFRSPSTQSQVLRWLSPSDRTLVRAGGQPRRG